MASNVNDPALWRLSTGGGIKYKLVNFEGEFQELKAGASLKVLIRGEDLIPFMQEMFPLPLEYGTITVPRYATFGPTNLRVQTVKFRSQDTNMPIDPFGFDINAPTDTYYKLIELDLGFATPTYGSQDPNNPQTFLEVTAQTSGEFIHTTPKSTTWQPLNSEGEADGDAVENRAPDIACTVMVPTTQWSVKWNKIPYAYFRDTLRPRLELMLGRVNSTPFTILYATLPTTLLFAGYTYSYARSWRSGYQDAPFITLDMKFNEKRIYWRDDITPSDAEAGSPRVYGPYVVRGHNDFWRPGYGWSRLLIQGREAYERWDFNTLFAVS